MFLNGQARQNQRDLCYEYHACGVALGARLVQHDASLTYGDLAVLSEMCSTNRNPFPSDSTIATWVAMVKSNRAHR